MVHLLPQDVNISVVKDLDPFAAPVAVTRNWIMYAKNSPFYGNQPFALVKGLEFVTGSAANIWWSTPMVIILYHLLPVS